MKTMLLRWSRTGLWVAFLTLAATVVAAPTEAELKREKIDQMSNDVLRELYARKPEVQDQILNAAGYAVFSNVGVNVIFVSAAGGHGVVVDQKNHRTYMKMGSAGVGFGVGLKDFRGVFVFHTVRRLREFIEKGWDFSGQADVAAKSDDKGGAVGTAGSLGDDIEVYQLTKNGLAVEASLQGTKYWKDAELN